MRKDVKNVVKGCVVCLRNEKTPVINHKAKALEISMIFGRFGLDITGGFPPSKEGHVMLLLIIEYLSKFVMGFALKTKSAQEVAEKLFEYIALFWAPKEILSDQGTEFNNQVVDALLKANYVEHRVTSAYHPRTNGLVERVNGTIA